MRVEWGDAGEGGRKKGGWGDVGGKAGRGLEGWLEW